MSVPLPLRLARELYQECPEPDRCHYLRWDDKLGPWCDSPLLAGIPPDMRTGCDTASLQLYCLDPGRHVVCEQYPRTPDERSRAANQGTS
jgi:hypothetical protein